MHFYFSLKRIDLPRLKHSFLFFIYFTNGFHYLFSTHSFTNVKILTKNLIIPRIFDSLFVREKLHTYISMC